MLQRPTTQKTHAGTWGEEGCCWGGQEGNIQYSRPKLVREKNTARKAFTEALEQLLHCRRYARAHDPSKPAPLSDLLEGRGGIAGSSAPPPHPSSAKHNDDIGICSVYPKMVSKRVDHSVYGTLLEGVASKRFASPSAGENVLKQLAESGPRIAVGRQRAVSGSKVLQAHLWNRDQNKRTIPSVPASVKAGRSSWQTAC